MPRSVWKGPFVDRYLLKKAEESRSGEHKGGVKTWSRRSTILPQFVGLTFQCLQRAEIYSRSCDRRHGWPQAR